MTFMAKIADYMDSPSTIEDEINEAADATATREPELPEQFQGKTAQEIAQSYGELQKLQDRQANELGELRKATSSLTEQLLHSPTTSEPVQEPITVDDLYADPQAAIDRAVEQRVSGKLDELERMQRTLVSQAAYQKIEAQHPTFREDAKSPEMQNWISESGYRQRLAGAADQGDVQAAEDLLGMYYDLKGEKEPTVEDPAIRAQQLRNASLESGATTVHTSVEKFSRSKLELARIRAKRGDREATQYLKENKDAIFSAYEEGRIVN
jgi:hypothetical protein